MVFVIMQNRIDSVHVVLVHKNKVIMSNSIVMLQLKVQSLLQREAYV